MTTVDMTILRDFMNRFVQDFGATLHAATVVLGDNLGLYKALSASPMRSDELARRTGTDVRYVHEWLCAQAAGGYVTYDPVTECFGLSPEQSMALAQEGSPAFIPGAFQCAHAMFSALSKLEDAFRTGAGLGWHEHHRSLYAGTERFFRPGYASHLLDEWIPAVEGLQERLRVGAHVADIGCGHGAATILMANAFPHSKFVGFDYHEPSIEYANKAAALAGVADRVRFAVADARSFEGTYDAAFVFDCLHDLGDPQGAAEHILDCLTENGIWVIVEPFAGDRIEDNLNPVGRIFYAASTCICTPASRAQEVGLCLGAQAGERRIQSLIQSAGFGHFRRATQTPLNLVFEARRTY